MNDAKAATGQAATVFCDDSELGYQRSRTDFGAAPALTLDESYRLAHLPLIAPEHPGVIARRDGTFYEMGRHPRVFSLVLPVDDGRLRASDAFIGLEAELKAASFAGKIAWDLLPKRSDRLHATICGSLATDLPPAIDAQQRAALSSAGRMQVELRGLFSGNVNRGRLYLQGLSGEARRGEPDPGDTGGARTPRRRISTSSASTISRTISMRQRPRRWRS